ncbi:MAG: VOC family protein [Chloroflexota bacterium]|jgi:catechol 2,3-dioxygenase-like lactoylglutathione lyase family enzyme
MSERRSLSLLDRGIAQIAMVVEDLDRTVERYHRTFGIGPWHFYTYGRPLLKRMTYHGRPASYRMRLALTYFGPTRIELIELVEGKTVYGDFVSEHGYGVQHLGVLVDDMDAALAEARAAGFTMLMDGAGFGLDGDGHFAYLDTEKDYGFMLELIERPKRRVPPERVYPPEQSSGAGVDDLIDGSTANASTDNPAVSGRERTWPAPRSE